MARLRDRFSRCQKTVDFPSFAGDSLSLDILSSDGNTFYIKTSYMYQSKVTTSCNIVYLLKLLSFPFLNIYSLKKLHKVCETKVIMKNKVEITMKQ